MKKKITMNVRQHEIMTFVADWICGGPEDKNQDMQDVWGIVLKNYYPEGRAVLFRATEHMNDGKIESYTGRIGVAEIFLNSKRWPNSTFFRRYTLLAF